jgi:hypothetical protein
MLLRTLPRPWLRRLVPLVPLVSSYYDPCRRLWWTVLGKTGRDVLFNRCALSRLSASRTYLAGKVLLRGAMSGRERF